MAIAAIDYGKRRVGLAIANAASDAAFHMETLRRDRLGPEFEFLCALLRRYDVNRIIIGLPLNMDGSHGAQARSVEAFGEKLRGRMKLPIEYEDERLTSFEAEERLKSLPIKRHKHKDTIDALAAAIILESWLSRQNATGL
ncbi:MAG: Holliday junction resolvase RuvX [Candidatus Binataceae bacterium]